MAYSTLSDIQSLFGSITFNSTSKVTDTDITNIHIPSADAMIDGRLRKTYSVPITNSDDLPLLKTISMNIAAGAIARIVYETTTQPNENAPAWAKFSIGEKLLNMIVKGEITLATGRSDTIYSRMEELYEEQDQDTDLAPLVTIDKEF
jgi:phage gp36-like protein